MKILVMKYFQLFCLCFFFLSGLAQQQSFKKISGETFPIDKKLYEGSGLAQWNGRLLAHNDSGDNNLYELDTVAGLLTNNYQVRNTQNTDWEDIAQDSLYFYIGDIGNNSGSRSILRILRVDKKSLFEKVLPIVDTISFAWPQTEESGIARQINFDCEAFITFGDSLYLFTKEYKTKRCTRLFSIPNKPGSYTARYRNILNTRMLITGATYHVNRKQLVLCGYNLWLRPFLLLFSNVAGSDFFSMPYTKYKLRLPFRQIEGVATFDGIRHYLISEEFKFLFFHRRPALHIVDINKN